MKKYKKSLVIAVGGGNDSVSTLLLQLQLNKQFNYNPDSIDILAVLPDCVQYFNMENLYSDILFKITPDSERFIDGKKIDAFPEVILSNHLSYFKELKLNQILGVSTTNGSLGIYKSLKYLIDKEGYDLVLTVDVGGDLIAHKDNTDVLSPMMDGLMLCSLSNLAQEIKRNKKEIDILYSVFGLGTDGESTPEMLDKALSMIPDLKEYSFEKDNINDFIPFYRKIVESNRYSRTTDYTIKEIMGEEHPNPSDFRARFHANENKYYAYFSHYQDPKYFGKFYLFKDVSKINSPYAFPCNSSLEWAIKASSSNVGLNHELNGQSLTMEGKRVFIGTPSNKFNKKDRVCILNDIVDMLIAKKYDLALIYNNDLYHIDNYDNLKVTIIAHNISLISI